MNLSFLAVCCATLLATTACAPVVVDEEDVAFADGGSAQIDASSDLAFDAALPDFDAAELGPDAAVICGEECTELGGLCHLGECMQTASLGFVDAFDDNIGGPLPTFIWGFSVQVETTSYGTALGFVGLPAASAGNSANAHIALYSDVGGSPDQLMVAMTEVANMPALVATRFEESFSEPLLLEPGTYWLMGKATSPTSPFASNLVVNGSGFPTFRMAFAAGGDAGEEASEFPQTLLNVNFSNNHAPNFFLNLIAP